MIDIQNCENAKLAASIVVRQNLGIGIYWNRFRYISFTNEFVDVCENEFEICEYFVCNGNACKLVKVASGVEDFWDLVIYTNKFKVQ